MIREYSLVVEKNKSVLNENLCISTYDKGIDIYFKIVNNSHINLTQNRYLHSDITLISPTGIETKSEICPIVDNKVIFTLSTIFMETLTELGIYKGYIRLFNYKGDETILPPIDIEYVEYIVSQTETTEAIANESPVNSSKIYKYADEMPVYNEDNSYNRTLWVAQDIITDTHLNKVEQSISDLVDSKNLMKEQIALLEKEKGYTYMLGTLNAPVVISDLTKGAFLLEGYIKDFVNSESVLLEGKNYLFITDVGETYLKAYRCFNTEGEFKYYKYDKTAEEVTIELNESLTHIKEDLTAIETTVTQTTEKINDLTQEVEVTTTKVATFNQSIDGFKTEVSQTYATKEETNTLNSSITQTANKINAIVTSDENTSEIGLTEEAINLFSKNIKLEGYTTINGGFQIDEEGNMKAQNAEISGTIKAEKGEISSDMIVKGMNVEGQLSASEINATEVNCNKIASALDGNINVTINTTNGDDTTDLVDGAIFATLQGCIEKIPKVLNGKKISIQLQEDINENILISGLTGGTFELKRNFHNTNGYIVIENCSAQMIIPGGNTDSDISNGVDTARPNVQPSALYSYGNYSASIVIINSPCVHIMNNNVYGKTDDANCYSIIVANSSKLFLKNTKIIGSYNGILATNLSQVYEEDSYGKVTKVSNRAEKGSIIAMSGTVVNGTIENTKDSQIINATSTSTGSDSTTDTGSSDVGSNDNTTVSTRTVTLTSDSANTYKLNVYPGWTNDNTCRQGDYGYGDCNGYWFFGNKFTENLKGKTIKKIVIKMYRQKGGWSAAIRHTLRMHNYTTAPSTVPTYVDGWSTTFTVATYNYITVTITDETLLTAIKDGNVKGFGLKDIYDEGHYSVMSGSCTITATIEG